MRVLLLAALLASPAGAMTIESRDIKADAPIPAAHIYPRCGGRNISPDLSWSQPPNGARSLVMTMIDLDVPPSLWSHWVVVDLPISVRGLPQGLSTLPAPARAIPSNFGDAAYDGPCPPNGTGTHRYQFTVWAMRTEFTTIAPDANAKEVLAKLSRESIDHASLTGTVVR
jgi:Raf kinase inhibitor-like YbhB/YbcL family protein